MKKYFLKSFFNSFGVLIYVLAISWLLFNADNIFPNNSASFLIPLFILLLFIISASITGLLVLGKPIHLYLSGFKKEAVNLFISTIGWLTFFLAIIIIILSSQF